MTIGGSTTAAELAAISRWTACAPAITREERLQRIERARAFTSAMGADALLINAGASLRYFAGVPWGATERLVAMLLPVRGEPIMVCPNFELGSLQADLLIDVDIRLWEEDEDPHALVADALAGIGGRTVAIDPALPFQMAERLRRAAPGIVLVDGAPAIDGCRMRKSPAEIALMQQAKDMTLEVHRRAARIMAPGITTTEVKRFIDEAHRAMGASGYSFCIVQYGRATAFPHGLPGEQRLEEGDLVLIDTGCTIEGYHSDITRTYAFGNPSDDQRAIWNLEKEAQAAAFVAAMPGAPCETVDAAARSVLEKGGLGPDYRLPGLPHRTGHGIGLSIHEPAYLVRGDRTLLDTGMCFSNEPMIVVPDRFGVRLEDHFYMTDAGPRWFTEPQPAIDRPFV
ncbi:M24 family metallopeptidase [Sphingomonas abietis]|uniref:Xaa-Pro peptidase family protein n=1 Tax=Sphingomonas abietis TaxID=3012344 RepID=A0ABY7NPY0_9SPHN|nr:Xaa-Pro peptidase family protein [Sphingomonas abietis]WBO23252.1 Xaa-Pro peptidase family protein [Sphingomonas abietis]